MNLPDHIHPIAVDDALLNIGMTINEIRVLTGDTAPTIIRTVEELEALDPDTAVYTPGRDDPVFVGDFLSDIRYDQDYADDLPAVVIRDGAEVRAARKALEEA